MRIALDDFGTGSSNLQWLTEVFYDEIKLDKFFVNGLKNEYKRAILTSLLDVVCRLNKQIVFEGVESKIDFEFVKSFDEDALIQGWYFYKSMPIEKLTALLLPRHSLSSGGKRAALAFARGPSSDSGMRRFPGNIQRKLTAVAGYSAGLVTTSV
ncbi:RNase II stability modulator [Raoultella planticola]|uniref:RNase II stability modulator n=1 Tax=Raoultella planticola TaxID=575 RepID=A0A485A8G7_RAOPL|nr:RNase II stability modulator [Raoultella planticola]